MDSSQKRELGDALFHRSHGGFELTLAPVLLGLIGLWLDRSLGIVPVLTVVLAVLGFVGVFVKLFFTYRYDMARGVATPAADPVAGPVRPPIDPSAEPLAVPTPEARS